MKAVTLLFKGGRFPAAQVEVEDDWTFRPVIVVPVPGAFGNRGFAIYEFRFRWLERDNDNKRDVYVFDGIDTQQ